MRREIDYGESIEPDKLSEDSFGRAVGIGFKRQRPDAEIEVQDQAAAPFEHRSR
jgi:hypothetical protein